MRARIALGVTAPAALALLALFLAAPAAADADDNASGALALAAGTQGPYDIDPYGDVDWFAFTLNGTAAVTLTLNGSSYGDTWMTLRDANETQLAYDDDGASYGFSRIQRVLTAGDYYAVVGGYGTIYGYYITLDAAPAASISEGANGPFSIAGGSIGWYSFSLSEAAGIYISTSGNANTLTMGLFRSGDQSSVASAYPGSNGTVGPVLFYFGMPGDYVLGVANASGSGPVSGYYLTLVLSPATTIGTGTNGPFAFDPDGAPSWFTFDVASAGMVALAFDSPLSAAEATLYNSYFSYVTSSAWGNASTGILLYAYVEVGTYYLNLHTYYERTAFNFTITVAFAGPEGFDGNDQRANATVLALGSNGPFDYAPSGETDWYVLTTASAGVLEFAIDNTSYGFRLIIYDVNGGEITGNYYCCGEPWVQYDAPAGTYYLQVYNYYGSGPIYGYTLSASLIQGAAPDGNDDAASATAVSEGDSGPYSLGRGDYDWYAYTATEPGTIYATTSGPHGGVSMEIRDENGYTVGCCGSNSSFSTISALVDLGTYYIVIGLPYNALVVSEYHLNITFVPWVSADGNDFKSQAVHINNGLNGPFDIDDYSDKDWYYFDVVDAGEGAIEVRTDAGGYSSSLFNSTGAPIFLNGNPNQFTAQMPKGRLYLLVQGGCYYYCGSTGPYSVNLTLPDKTPPELILVSPANRTEVEAWAVTISGITEAGARVWVNGVEVTVTQNGGFSAAVLVPVGNNTVTIIARDAKNNEAQATLFLIGIDPTAALDLQIANLTAQIAALQQQLASAQASAAAEANGSAQANASLAETQADLNGAQSQLDQQNGTIAALQAEAAAQRSVAMGSMLVAAIAVIVGAVLAMRRKHPPAPKGAESAPAAQAPKAPETPPKP